MPCLRKDFMVHPIQVLQAREAGASAILIIVRALTDDEITALFAAAATRPGSMRCSRSTTRPNSTAPLRHGARIIGVNNRDLAIFKTDLGLSRTADPAVPQGCDRRQRKRHLHRRRRRPRPRRRRPCRARRRVVDAHGQSGRTDRGFSPPCMNTTNRPCSPGREFFRRLGWSVAAGIGLIFFSLSIGMVGYHFLGELAWIDAFLDAAMILSGMGPLSPCTATPPNSSPAATPFIAASHSSPPPE